MMTLKEEKYLIFDKKIDYHSISSQFDRQTIFHWPSIAIFRHHLRHGGHVHGIQIYSRARIERF